MESYVTKRRDRKAALKFLRKSMKRYGQSEMIMADKLRPYGAAMKVIGNAPYSASDKCDVCRNSPQSTTISIRSAFSATEIIASSTEPPL